MNNKQIDMKNVSEDKLHDFVKERYWLVYRLHTTTLSNTCRQLALGEGGLCWLIISSNNLFIPASQVNVVLISLVLFFLFDVVQYLFSSESYKNLATTYDRQIKSKTITRIDQLELPENINTPSRVCFTIKLFILIAASLFLIFSIVVKHSC